MQQAGVAAICFDLFTLFDPRTVVAAAERQLPGHGSRLCQVWQTRQFQYSWLRVAAGQYRDFEAVTAEALEFALRDQRLELSSQARRQLVGTYSALELWPDAREHLAMWRRAGLKLAPLANFAPWMIERLLGRVGLIDSFDALISTDAARTFKPAPQAYALGPARFGLRRDQIVFSAFGGWDAVGAKWFGFRSFWVNRLGVTAETLGAVPDGSGPSFAELASFVDGLGVAAEAG